MNTTLPRAAGRAEELPRGCGPESYTQGSKAAGSLEAGCPSQQRQQLPGDTAGGRVQESPQQPDGYFPIWFSISNWNFRFSMILPDFWTLLFSMLILTPEIVTGTLMPFSSTVAMTSFISLFLSKEVRSWWAHWNPARDFKWMGWRHERLKSLKESRY